MMMRSGLVLGFLFLGLGSVANAGIPVEVAASPDSNLTLIMAAVQSAQSSILMNIYELTSPDLTNLLICKIQQGVTVQILEEGQPFGGMVASEKPVESELIKAMNQSGNSNNRYVLMTNQNNTSVTRRFVYDHAKYMVIDQNAVFVGSENYSNSGQTPAGKEGTRGWEVFIHSPELAPYFINTFNSDSNPSEPDIMNVLNSSNYAYSSFALETRAAKKPKPQPVSNPVACTSSTATGSVGYSSTTADAISPVFSPETSEQGILKIINEATSTLDIEQYSFESLWKKSRQNSPILEAILAAAQRGVTVRVLLNDDTSSSGQTLTAKMVPPASTSSAPSMNTTSMNSLNQLAQQQNLPIQARIANLSAMGVYYIHNKGVLADADKTLVSSINWTENAVTANREAAVLLTSQGIHSYYEALFEQDWEKSQ